MDLGVMTKATLYSLEFSEWGPQHQMQFSIELSKLLLGVALRHYAVSVFETPTVGFQNNLLNTSK